MDMQSLNSGIDSIFASSNTLIEGISGQLTIDQRLIQLVS